MIGLAVAFWFILFGHGCDHTCIFSTLYAVFYFLPWPIVIVYVWCCYEGKRRILVSVILIVSLICIFLGFGLSAFGPQGSVWESSRSCPSGGKYYSHIYTSLCGDQYGVCVSFDRWCGNDCNPPEVKRSFPIYGGESAILAIGGLVGLFVGFWLLSKINPKHHYRTKR